MVIKKVSELPHNIQMHIQSYLYFSKEVAEQMRVVNYIIKNYDDLLWKEIKRIFHHDMNKLYTRFMQYMYTNETFFFTSYYCNSIDSEEQVMCIIQHMNIIEKQKAYNYIMFHV